MAHVTFIHGIANKPPQDRLHYLWLRALERDDPRPAVFCDSNFGINFDTYHITSKMVYWADVLYAEPDPDESGYEALAREDLEGLLREGKAPMNDSISEMDTALLSQSEAMEKIKKQMGLDKTLDDGHYPSPEEICLAGKGAYQLERVPLPWWAKKYLMKIFLRDVHHYLFNVSSNPKGNHTYKVRDELRLRLIKELENGASEEGPHILVSHSMGTVIAYDVLRNCPECPSIDHLITLGSPLGLDEVQDRLKHHGTDNVDFPSDKLNGEWINVFDHLDPVAGFDPFFANDYQKDGKQVVKGINEQNWGEWRHSIQKYLSGPKFRAELKRLLCI